MIFLLFLSALSIADLPMMQGLTTDDSVQINFLINKNVEFSVSASAFEDTVKPAAITAQDRDFSDTKAVKIKFNNLKKNTTYELKVEDGNGNLLDSRFFKTYKKHIDQPTIAIASCMDDRFLAAQKKQWDNLVSFKPDLILFIGDNVYVDNDDEDISKNDLWKRYVQTRNRLEIFRIKTLIPILATWDDHDYGIDNGGANFRFKQEAQDVFNAFYAQNAEGTFETGPGVSSFLKFFGLNIFLMDNRSFKTRENLWGNEQYRWLFDKIKENASPTLIVNGIQFFGGYHPYESYEKENPRSFSMFKDDLKKLDRPFLLISGDRHLTELMSLDKSDVGRDTYEFTSSGIHSGTYPNSWQQHPNFRKVEGASGVLNFGILKFLELAPLTIDLKSVGPDRKILFGRTLTIK